MLDSTPIYLSSDGETNSSLAEQMPPPTRTAKALTVFCGSSLGTRPEYVQAAKEVGEALAQAEITLI